ncbi:hypothetical protein ABWI01_03275 [Oceanicaulis alexandrii]|uniref:hypothetical protein n=1 Tax=Oceanicaulis alexandrii TaxID=153233 RepID=UPI0035D0777B
MSVLIGGERWKAIFEGAECTSSELVMIAQALGCRLHDLTPFDQHGPMDLEPHFARLAKSAALADSKDRSRIFESVRIIADMFDGRATLLMAVAAGGLLATSAGWWRAHETQMQTERSYTQLLDDMGGIASANLSAGRALEDQGRGIAARTALETAVDTARARLGATRPGSQQALNATYDLAQAVFWLAEYHSGQGNAEETSRGFAEYADLTQALYDADPENPSYREERAYGRLNLAALALNQHQFSEALEGFTLALREFQALKSAGHPVPDHEIGNAMGWRADALIGLGRLNEALNVRLSELALYEATPETRMLIERRLNAGFERAALLVMLGEIEDADVQSSRVAASAEAFFRENPDSINAQRRFIETIWLRAELALSQGNIFAAKTLADNARGTIANAIPGDLRAHPREAASLSLLDARIAIALGAHERGIRAAERALDYLGELEGPDQHQARQTARAFELLGDGWLGLGDEFAAQRAWQNGFAAISEGGQSALNDAVLSRLAYRIDDVDSASAARERLNAIGYQHPAHLAFWADVDGGATVQSQSSMGDTDG